MDRIWNAIGRTPVGRFQRVWNNSRGVWPEAGVLDTVALIAAVGLLPIQGLVLRFAGRHGGRVRRLKGRATHGSPLRVLHVTCSFDVGGTQRQVMNLCEAPHDSRFVHDAIEIFPEQNFLYRRDATIDFARYAGHTVVGRTMGRLIANLSTRSTRTLQIYKLARDFRALRPDIVVGWGHEMCMLTFLAAALERVPHIAFCIRTFNPSFGWTSPEFGRFLHESHSRMYPFLSTVITNSTVLRNDYSHWLGIPRDAIQVCPNGVDISDALGSGLARDEILRRFDIPPGRVVLCNIGRFSAEKGQMVAVQANVRLVEKYGNEAPIWLFCGDGPELGPVREFAAARGMTNVRFAGRVEDIQSYLAASDIFVMPSDFEGMPNAMMEAMLQSLPSVSTNRSGAIDIARDGQEALYCPPGDPESLASRLMTLIDSPAERVRMGRNARARIGEFSVRHAAQRFDQCLAEALVHLQSGHTK